MQAYDSPGDNTGRDNLDSRLNSTIRNFDGHLTAEEVAKKCVKGGGGTYHMEYEYTIDGTEESYPYLRNAIRIMNPPVK